jgi:phosphotriesterase-related protein
MTRARLTGRTLDRYHPFISPLTVPSVLGPVDGDALGFVLPHEHLTVDNRIHHAPRPGLPSDARVGVDTLGEVRVWPRALTDNIVLDDDPAVLADLRTYLAAGGRTLVEVTPIGMGRDLERLRRFAQASGVHVIASTAYYVQRGHGDLVAGRTAEHIAAEFIHDLTQAAPRCGMIGEIGISAEPHPDELTVLQAALLAQEATGAPITIHVTTIRPVSALLDFLERSGRPLDRIVLGHMDYDLRTLAPHRRALQLGLTVELDLFGYPAWTNANFLHFPTDSQRISALLQLASEGYADQLLMSHDVCQKMQLTSRGGFGYAHIPAHVAALFEALGAPPDLYHRLGVVTPRRLLCWDRGEGITSATREGSPR